MSTLEILSYYFLRHLSLPYFPLPPYTYIVIKYLNNQIGRSTYHKSKNESPDFVSDLT